jgi:hypothetical protein
MIYEQAQFLPIRIFIHAHKHRAGQTYESSHPSRVQNRGRRLEISLNLVCCYYLPVSSVFSSQMSDSK